MKFGQEVLIEQWIEGQELSVSFLNGQPLPAVKVVPASGFYDYNAKHQVESTQYHVPCGLNEQEEKKLQELALKAFYALGCRHWGRVDFIQDTTGQFWLIEVNTIPGLTTRSILPKAAKSIGIDSQSLVMTILDETMPNKEKNK